MKPTTIKLCPALPLEGDGEDIALDRLFVRSADSPLLDLFVRAGETTSTDAGIETTFTASTAAVDRMGDSIDQGTWRLANWRRNPVILHEHAPPVIGRGVGKRSAEALTIKVLWDASDANPTGQLVAHQHANGFRSAGSVGFIPGKAINRLDLPDDDARKAPKDTPRWRAGHVFSHNELLEFSSVAVPANAEALQLSLYAAEVEGEDDRIRRFVSASTDSLTAETILRALREDDAVRRAIRGLIWSESDPEPAPATDGPTPLASLFAK